MIKRIVTVTQVVALLSAVAFVVLLFANEPDNGASAKPSTPSASNASSASETTGAPATPDGAAVFANRCASCHGSDGGGGLGPQLSGGRAAQRFPNIADQIGVIADGRGGMPAFGNRLSEAEIKAVAEYTRTL